MENLSLIKNEVFKNIDKNKINAIVLYGSRSRGDYSNNSDYDINVYLNNNNKAYDKSLSIPEKDIWINIINKKQFQELKSKGHSFLYCAFRDGKTIYQNKDWFDKTKPEVLKIKPTKKIIELYLSSALEMLDYLIKGKLRHSLDYEEGKVIANKIGFAILMKDNIYPISPHTVKKELINQDNKNKEIAKTIEYLQKIYYNNKEPKKEKYIQELIKIYQFTKQYASKNFPNILRHLS